MDPAAVHVARHGGPLDGQEVQAPVRGEGQPEPVVGLPVRDVCSSAPGCRGANRARVVATTPGERYLTDEGRHQDQGPGVASLIV